MAATPRRSSRAGLALAASPAMLLDEVGKAILRELQDDGRRSYTAIAAAVGLSEAGSGSGSRPWWTARWCRSWRSSTPSPSGSG